MALDRGVIREGGSGAEQSCQRSATNASVRPRIRSGQSCWRLHCPGVLVIVVTLLVLAKPVATQANIDGGRSDLPGMKQDIFDQVQKNKKSGPTPRGKGPPDCPKSDGMSPFFGLAFASGEMYVRINSTEGECKRLITIAGANYTVLFNASKTCGPAGEWKKRIAEELSAVFFQGGLEWVRSENETLEVITEEGTFQAVVSEEKYAEQSDCWKRGCGCEQAKNPKMRMVFMAVLVISVGGLGYDSLKLAWEKVKGKKPSKHVVCPKGHRMIEVKISYSHHCDVCGVSGTTYQSSGNPNYDMCKKCYKEAKKKVKAKWKEWLEKHPEDNDKKGDTVDKEDEDDKDVADEKESIKAEGDAERRSEPESTTASAAAGSEAEQDEETKDDEKKNGEKAVAKADEDSKDSDQAKEQKGADGEGGDGKADGQE